MSRNFIPNYIMSFFSFNENNRKLVAIIFISTVITFFLTSNKLPIPIIAHDKMVAILVDLELAKSSAYNYNHNDDEAKQIFMHNLNLIYSTHGLSSEEFKENYVHYINNPQEFLQVYNDVVYKLESML